MTKTDPSHPSRPHASFDENSERYRIFLSHSSEGIWRFEIRNPVSIHLPIDEQIERFYQEAYLAECNEAMAKMYGFTAAQEMLGRKLGDFLIRSDERNREFLKAFIMSDYHLMDVESHEVDKNGDPRIFLNNLKGIVENGFLRRAWGVQQDITVRKHMEDDLRQSQQKLEGVVEEFRRSERIYRAIGESIQYGSWVCDPTGKNIYASESFLKLVGLTQQECSQFGWGKTLHPDDVEETIAAWKECVATGSFWEREHRFLGVDGKYHPVLARGVPIKDEEGRIICWAGINLDISRLKKAEEEAKAKSHSLEVINKVGQTIAAELDLQKLVQAVTDAGREVSGAQFGAFFYNQTNEQGEIYHLYTLSGAPREAFEKFGMPRNTPIFAPTFRSEKIIRSGDILKDPAYGKMGPHYGMPKGHLPVRSYLAVPVVSRSGVVLGGLLFGHSQPDMFTEQSEQILAGIAAQAAIAIDNANLYETVQKELTHHKRTEEALSYSNRELEQFAYVASHDLREPLHIISSFVDLLSNRCGAKLDGKEKEYLQFIKQSSEKAKTLIRELLEYSRIGRNPVSHDVDLQAVIGDVLTNLKLAIEQSKADIVCGPLPRMTGQHMEIVQLFQNLISNAIKYRRAENPRIEIASQAAGRNEVLITVKDNGIGIEPAYHQRVFDMFQRLHAADEYEGTGIGLAICKKIVEHYGGKIWIESQLGHGATFFFTLKTSQ